MPYQPSQHFTGERQPREPSKLIGDSSAHFEPHLYGESAWDTVDKLTIPLHLIGSNELVKISSKPPQGYGYIEIFHLSHQNQVR